VSQNAPTSSQSAGNGKGLSRDEMKALTDRVLSFARADTPAST
jgi:hypothetical protein